MDVAVDQQYLILTIVVVSYAPIVVAHIYQSGGTGDRVGLCLT